MNGVVSRPGQRWLSSGGLTLTATRTVKPAPGVRRPLLQHSWSLPDRQPRPRSPSGEPIKDAPSFGRGCSQRLLPPIPRPLSVEPRSFRLGAFPLQHHDVVAPTKDQLPRDWPNQLENTTLAAMTKPSKSRTPQRATKKKSRSGRKQKPASSPKKRVAPKTNPPPQWGWETPDTTNELLLGRAAVRRRQFEAALQPAQEEVFAPVPPSTSIGRHNELLARNSEVEETITQLEAQGIPGIGHNQPPLTSDEIAQIRELLAGIRETPVVPPAQRPSEYKATAS